MRAWDIWMNIYEYLSQHYMNLAVYINTLESYIYIYIYMIYCEGCQTLYWHFEKWVTNHYNIFLFQMGPEYCSILRKAMPTIILQLEIDEVFLSLFRPHDIFEDGTFDDISVSKNERNSKVWLHMYENCHHQFDKQRIRRTIFTNKATHYRYHSEVWWCAFALINWVAKGLLPHT